MTESSISEDQDGQKDTESQGNNELSRTTVLVPGATRPLNPAEISSLQSSREQAQSDKIQARQAKAEWKAAKKTAKRSKKSYRHLRRELGVHHPHRIRLDVHGRQKPLMRGWIHAGACPLALAGGIVAICLAPGAAMKWACAIYMTCSLLLFGNSAIYHIGDWNPTVTDLLRRFDHLNIFLLIAGTYTPLSLTLPGRWRTIVLVGMWSCTTVAIIVHVIWIHAPRWLYTLVYVIFGVAGVAFLSLFWNSPTAGPVVVWLILAGGIVYILGAIVYGVRRPDPWPRVFGFHEIFHTRTVLAYACHMVAIFFVIAQMRG
jgi:hemolysin III